MPQDFKKLSLSQCNKQVSNYLASKINTHQAHFKLNLLLDSVRMCFIIFRHSLSNLYIRLERDEKTFCVVGYFVFSIS